MIIIGAPLDLTECYRSGTGAAPDRVREVSEVLESFSPTQHADLDDLALVDWGNVDLASCSMAAALTAIADAAATAAESGLTIMIGGEHTATLGAIRGLLQTYPDLVVIHVDAHADLRADYLGLEFSHATVMRRIADEIGLNHIAQYGIRSTTREEFELGSLCLARSSALQMSAETRDRIGQRPCYLTVDIDVLDPGTAPGTGCPEPGGAAFRELEGFLHSLHGLNVVGFDVMEILPAADVNDITAVAGAKLIREAALAFARKSSTLPAPTSR